MSILPGGAHPFARENINDGGFSVSASAAIRIDSLTKSFGWRPGKRVRAVEDLSLEVAAGQVYGFLGPNGAGKTTTIRMLLDLIRPDRGDVFLFGRHIRRERTVLRRVGSLVEGASFYDFLTGQRNLEVLALTSNLDLPAAQFDAVLDLVDMREASRRRVRGYSTGMKQRLGIAAAMLTRSILASALVSIVIAIGETLLVVPLYLLAALLRTDGILHLYRVLPGYNLLNFFTWLADETPEGLEMPSGELIVDGELFSAVVLVIWMMGLISLSAYLFNRQDI